MQNYDVYLEDEYWGEYEASCELGAIMRAIDAQNGLDDKKYHPGMFFKAYLIDEKNRGKYFTLVEDRVIPVSADHTILPLWQTYEGCMAVSTVFLGFDASHGVAEEPLVFETMVFGFGYKELACRRCSTYEGAMMQHSIAVKEWITK